MALVKLEINGKRMIAADNQTILSVARENGISDIPTLCHDDQLEPFTSCFVCVVKVKGARSLMPACSTKVTEGMVVETDNAEVRRSRKAAVELLLSNHNADCVGPCQLECPAGVDIQGYVALAALGKYREAIQLIKQRNPLPAICGRVCTRPCEVTGCRRNLLDSPVGIDNIKRFVADIDLGDAQPYRPVVAKANGKRVAIVGAGPGGLSSAFYLALAGYEVHIFEAQPEAGGMLRYGIPEYRLPKEVLDAEIGQILELGVKLMTNVALGRDFTVKSLKNQGFDAVFLALGAWESSVMRVKNEQVTGVLPGIEFLKNVGLHRKVEVSGKVIVVGGGNTAIDCARTALRFGAGEVTLLYRRTRAEMPANPIEIEEAELEGVNLVFLAAPTEVIAKDGHLVALQCVRMELGAPDSSGRRSPKPIAGSEFQIACDFVIAAIGQGTTMRQLVGSDGAQFAPEGETLKLTRWDTVQVNDSTFETTVDGVFAGGDVVTGAATVVEAVAAGRKAAYAIDRYIMTGKAEPEPQSFISRRSVFGKVTVDDLRSMEQIPRRHMPVIKSEERRGSFAEVELGYAADDVHKESARCQQCGCDAFFSCDLRDLATRYHADPRPFLGAANQYRLDRSHPLIELDANKCILCGRCVRMCSEVVGISAFGFVKRGFDTMVRPALGGSLLDTDCVSCGLCVGTCPTGAITAVVPLAKPGPWATTAVSSVCHFCGVGCEIQLHAHGDTFVTSSRIESSQNTLGNHCKKGRFGYEYVQASDRALRAMVRTGHELQRTTLDDAINYTGMRLKELSGKVRPEEVAVFVSPRFTNEEIYLAQKLARVVLGTHNVASFANLLNPESFYPDVVSTGTYADLVGAQVIVVVGADLPHEHFTVDLLVKRAIRNGARLLFVGSSATQSAQLADVCLECKPGTEAEVLLALAGELGQAAPGGILQPEELPRSIDQRNLPDVSTEAFKAAARLLAGSVARVVVFNKDWRGLRAAQDERIYAAFAQAIGASTLALRERSNMQGLLDMGAHPDWFPGYLATDDATAIARLEREWCVALSDLRHPDKELMSAIVEQRIKVAIVLGEDPLGSAGLPEAVKAGLRGLDFLVVGDLFMTPTAQAAQVFLPLCSLVETEGTLTNHERRIQRVARSIPARNGMENWQILSQLAARMGGRFRMKYQSPAEVWAEIQRVAPIYAGVSLERPLLADRWDLAQFPLQSTVPTLSTAASVHTPHRTDGLDAIDRRFEHRTQELFERARQAQATTAQAAQ
jgi:formate dehydrogenase major subunit